MPETLLIFRFGLVPYWTCDQEHKTKKSIKGKVVHAHRDMHAHRHKRTRIKSIKEIKASYESLIHMELSQILEDGMDFARG